MAKKQRGEPVYTVRMPRHIITALQMMARDQGNTPSGIIRALVEEELKRCGYPITIKPIEGQVKMNDDA